MVFTKITHYSCAILMEFELSRRIFDKYSNIKFHENPSSRTELFHADRRAEGQTDKHEANSRPSQFCERT